MNNQLEQTLAIRGGSPIKRTPFGKGKRFSGRELEYLEQALNQETLFYDSGKFVGRFTEKFADMYGMKYCAASSSGTAAVHTALAVLGVGSGDEVIVPPITDMGGVIGVLAQGAVPVFADVDAHTYNMTPEGIEDAITDRTKAILATHLAGNPCDMDEILSIAHRRGVKVAEDCAQAYYSYYKGRLVGTFGDIGCFSTNDFKHISTGEGGMCVMNDNDLYNRAIRFVDKGYNRRAETLQEMRAVDSLCMNYRMTELQGAVGLAQLDRLKMLCEKREELGAMLTSLISDVEGISPPLVKQDCRSSYWFYMLRLDLQAFPGGNDSFATALKAEGIPAEAGYIGRCVYEYELMQKNERRYPKGLCPTAEAILGDCVKLPWSEFYTADDVSDIAAAIKKLSLHRMEL
jgi:dTDP-4-amino-4,6-dideoxygalactose transaminase